MEKAIERFSLYLQQELGLNEDQREVVAFGLYMMGSFVFGYLAVGVVGWLCGIFWLALTAAVTASILRVVSGGAHSACMLNCALFGGIVSPGLALLAALIYPILSVPVLYILVAGAWSFCLWGIYQFAPADTPQKPIKREADVKRYRRLSFGVLIGWAFVVVGGFAIHKISGGILLASTLGLAWQVFSMMPAGYSLVSLFDRLMPKSC